MLDLALPAGGLILGALGSITEAARAILRGGALELGHFIPLKRRDGIMGAFAVCPNGQTNPR